MNIYYNRVSLSWNWWYLWCLLLLGAMFFVCLMFGVRYRKGKIRETIAVERLMIVPVVLSLILISLESFRGIEQMALNMLSFNDDVFYAYFVGLPVIYLLMAVILVVGYYIAGKCGSIIAKRIITDTIEHSRSNK